MGGIDGYINGSNDGLIDGWMGVWMDEGINGWMDRQILLDWMDR